LVRVNVFATFKFCTHQSHLGQTRTLSIGIREIKLASSP
jgi:hypothetical protein